MQKELVLHVSVVLAIVLTVYATLKNVLSFDDDDDDDDVVACFLCCVNTR